ncbi:hypothetical protein NOVOSPHI9U_420415 [Novosphingobium sp. 9U]|nr:hypothetical protein NOVOSPHI9U_420415 [Novosphingobium sp. 9U]
MANSARLQALLDMDPEERRAALARMSEEERKEFSWHWELWARTEQLAPQGDWRTWLIMAGRGFGKTRAGAEWVRAVAENDPEARIALVAASLPEARAVMVEGESGLLAVCPPRRRPLYEPSLRRVTWPNGAQALLFSAGEPESLRGPQHSHACGAGTKGSLPQRSTGADRRTDACCRRGRDQRAADHRPGRTIMAGNRRRDWRVDGP